MSPSPDHLPSSTPASESAALDQEAAALAAHCRALQAWLNRRLTCTTLHRAEAVRCVVALSQATTRLAAVLTRRAAITGPAELEQFFADVARRASELDLPGPQDPPGPP